MRANDLCMAVVLGCLAVLTFMRCSPSAQREAEFTVDDTTHKAALTQCRLDAKAQPEGQQFSYFCECWKRVNTAYRVDAGECAR